MPQRGANNPGIDNVGYGVFLRNPVRNIAIGAVRCEGDAGSETGIVLNFNRAALIQQYENLDLEAFLKP